MDEAGFNLSTGRHTRRVGPTKASSKSQASLAAGTHITIIATIGTSDAPVPPYLIYSGAHILEEWVAVRDRGPKLMANTTDSGWANSYIIKEWLTECFDPYTKARAGSSRRLLFLNGLESHVQVDFLEECWARKIVCIILPTHMSGVYQPLDVNFFNTLKLKFHKLVDNY
jgi:hypothetical protein